MKYNFSTEIFSIPYKDNHIIYAPLKRLAFMISPRVVNLLYEIASNSGAEASVTGERKKLLKPFYELGLIGGSNDGLPAQVGNVFSPNYVTLFLTGRCNLRCIYCYASGGEKEKKTISLSIAKSAIDFIAHNALLRGQKSIGVGFHGGGEPTLAWSVLVGCVEYAKKKAAGLGLKANFSLATNGVISEKRIAWIMDNFSGLNLSLDGPEEIQNHHRPLANGRGSFSRVMKNVKMMNDRNFPYGIRSTVTARSVAHLDRITDFFGRACRARVVHFEPTFACGRCLCTGIEAPSAGEFIEGFRKARIVAEKLGISIYYSGARLNTITTVFCKAPGDSFCVTPRGDVTSCYEVCSRDDPRSEVFFYGKYDNKKKAFMFSEKKLAYLRERTINNIPYCEDCFCKYHCAGDCLSKASDGIDLMSIKNPARCKINQALTLDNIVRIFDRAAP
jgi:uncharacterized protein